VIESDIVPDQDKGMFVTVVPLHVGNSPGPINPIARINWDELKSDLQADSDER
jgi:hypothetical protein